MTFDISRIMSSEIKRPILVAGPCAIESKEQTMATIAALADLPLDFVRGGIWKPRTCPGCFEGVGDIGLSWLKDARQKEGFPFAVEVALPEHVEAALRHDVDAVWIGARTTVNPFAVQALADALKGTNVPVMVKNPICPELSLWLGSLERFARAGVGPLMAIHRGFSLRDNGKYRYHPVWEIGAEFMQKTDTPLICDPSHIAGTRELVEEVARQALEYGYHGLMIESHINPSEALSDSRQQLTPDALKQLFVSLGLISSEKADSGEHSPVRRIEVPEPSLKLCVAGD